MVGDSKAEAAAEIGDWTRKLVIQVSRDARQVVAAAAEEHLQLGARAASDLAVAS